MRSAAAIAMLVVLAFPASAAQPYPKGVVEAGLQDVFDARPGPVRPFAKQMSAGPPAHFYEIVAGTYGWKGGGVLPDFDASGSDLYFNGGDFKLENFKASRRNSGVYLLAVGHVNGGGQPASLTLSNALIDQSAAGVDRGAIVVGRGSRFAANRVSFLHASGTNLNLAGDSTLTDVYFDSPGQNPADDAHTEGPHYFEGTHTVLRGFFDARDARGKKTHATALVYVEAANGNVDVTIKDSILAGAKGIAIYSPIQVFAKGSFRATLRMQNVVLQAGTQSYVVAGANVTVFCTQCRDYDTGAIVDAQINKANR